MKDPWQKVKIDFQRCKRFQIGPLKLWIFRDTNEWMVANDYLPGEKRIVELGIEAEKPEDLAWNQYIAGDEEAIIQFIPCMPDLPLVVRPKNPTTVIKGLHCTMFVFVPLWVKVVAGSKGQLKLCEIPSIILSKTWFGDTMSGEPCYSMRIPAELSILSNELGVHRVICPVIIENKSDQDLKFQRLCVRGDHLCIFKGNQCNWTNEVRVRYEGDDQASEIRYLEKPPPFDNCKKLVNKCRIAAPKNLVQKVFGGIKSWSF